MFWPGSKRMSGAETRPETTTQVSEKHQTFPIEDQTWLVETIPVDFDDVSSISS